MRRNFFNPKWVPPIGAFSLKLRTSKSASVGKVFWVAAQKLVEINVSKDAIFEA